MEREQEIHVQLDRFDGPLALLLHLIQKEDFAIKDLNLNTITKQYLAYLNKMNELDFDVAGEYLYMASTLLFLKSKYCVDEEDKKIRVISGEDLAVESEADLIAKLEALERYQGLSKKLWDLPKLGEQTFTRPKLNRKKIVDSMTAPMDLSRLTESMIEYLVKNHRKYKVVKRDRVSIKEKLKTLAQVLKQGETSEFSKLVEQEKGADDLVITFISLLELARLKKVSIFQNEGMGEIYVDVLKELTQLDIEGANGFDPEGEEDITEELTQPEVLQ